MKRLKGIDVSQYQGKIDWLLVAENVDFALIRCSIIGLAYPNNVDLKFYENWEKANGHNIAIGTYCVHQPLLDVKLQIDNYLQHRPVYSDFPPIIDVEISNGLSSDTITKHLLGCINYLYSQTGVYPIIYTSAGFWEQHINIAVFGDTGHLKLWLASWTSEPHIPRGWNNYYIWQYSSTGNVPGIQGAVDMNSMLEEEQYSVILKRSASRYSGLGVDAILNPVKYPINLGIPIQEMWLRGPDNDWVHLEADDFRIDCLSAPVPPNTWSYPVGEGAYPAASWYVANLHQPPQHIGIDLNLDVTPWGDVERNLDLSIYALADGIVTYRTENWSGVPMIVIKHQYNQADLWVRYAHIVPRVYVGDKVVAGQALGKFANWTGNDGGDHLHLDMATTAYTREYTGTTIPFIDPLPVLKAQLDPTVIDAMVSRG